MKFQESALAHQLLDHLTGIEIGGAAHNPFNLPNCKNVDFTDDPETVFKQAEFKLCGEKMPVDYVAEGDHLPFPDESFDYVISSHVWEHFPDPIKAMKEWLRVVKPGGYVYTIVPTADALPEEDRPPHTLQHLLDRHSGKIQPEDIYMGNYQNSTVTGLPLHERGHWTVFDMNLIGNLCAHFNWKIVAKQDRDDKVKNGHCVVIRK